VQVKQHQPKARIILLSGYSDMQSTIAAINDAGILKQLKALIF
jgi:ActR/RegA family two-component response regulator